MTVLGEQLLSSVLITTPLPQGLLIPMTASKLFDFLGRVLMAADVVDGADAGVPQR